MIVRALQPKDIPQIIELSRQLAEHVDDAKPDLTSDVLQDLAFGKTCWFEALVGENGGQVVGFVAFRPAFELHTNTRALFVSDLAIAHHWRGRGVGKRLIDALRDVATDYGCTSITLEIWVENLSAREFYAKQGAWSEHDIEKLRIPVSDQSQ